MLKGVNYKINLTFLEKKIRLSSLYKERDITAPVKIEL